MVMNRLIRGHKLCLAAVTSVVAVGAIVMPAATALADDEPTPGANILRNAENRGIVNAGPADTVYERRFYVYSDGDDVSKGKPIVLSDGNKFGPCYGDLVCLGIQD